MKYKTILFDLDGTLLPMDLDAFKKDYFTMLVKSISNHGYEPSGLMQAILLGIDAMLKNDGEMTNEKAFFDVMYGIYGDKIYSDKVYFEEFYDKEFDNIKKTVGFNPDARWVVTRLKEAGYRLILATNPVFPVAATYKRMAWAGIDPSFFELITTYENSNFSKPRKEYYKEIIDKARILPSECLMVGNDTSDDLAASEIGIGVFLVTDNLINGSGIDVSKYPNGKLQDLLTFIGL